MTNIVVLCHNRYLLTRQCIRSIRENTNPEAYNLTLVDDNSDDFRVREFLVDQAKRFPKNTTLVQVTGGKHCLGALKNLGTRHSELTFGRGETLCVMDNDVYVFPNWLGEFDNDAPDDSDQPVIIGGICHPFHHPIAEHDGWTETDAVAGYCQAMTWEAWDAYGPYDANASGIGQSEDWAICQRARNGGNGFAPEKVGYANPPVMVHCGVTDSNGKPIGGAEHIVRVPGILYL